MILNENLLNINNFPTTWQKATITKLSELEYEITQGDAPALGGITESDLSLAQGKEYTLILEISSNDLIQGSYMHIVDKINGNKSFGPIKNLICDGNYHKYTITFTPIMDHTNVSILIGVTFEALNGYKIKVKNIKLVKGADDEFYTPNKLDTNKQELFPPDGKYSEIASI